MKINFWKNKSARSSDWFASLRSKKEPEEINKEFQSWIEQDDQNRNDYERCEAIWELAGDLSQKQEFKSLIKGCDDYIESQSRHYKFRRVYGIAASLFVCLLGVIIVTALIGPENYQTLVGEQRTVILEDNSLITLNTNTRIKVSYKKDLRKIELIYGQALFDVESDKKRPFEVYAAGGIVRAIGTRFDVSLIEQEVNIAVLEGTVEVTHSNAVITQDMDVPKVTQGQSVMYSSAGEISKLEDFVMKSSGSWWEGKLDFDSYRLADAIDEFNRYTNKKMIIEDKELGEIQFTGVFRIRDTDAFIFALKEAFNIDAVRKQDSILLVQGIDIEETLR